MVRGSWAWMPIPSMRTPFRLASVSNRKPVAWGN